MYNINKNIGRIIYALAGPVMLAGANFLFSLSLQQTSSASVFGIYAFTQVVLATGLGISNSLFSTPIVVAFAEMKKDECSLLGSFLNANLVFCILGGVIAFFIIKQAGATINEAFIAAVLSIVMWLRWYLRSVELGLRHWRPTVVADVIYGILAIIGLAALLLEYGVNYETLIILQIACCLLSLIPLVPILARSVVCAFNHPFAAYASSFMVHGRWAVTAMVATQITASAHAYAITLFLGPAVFAPIAFAALLFRPFGAFLTGIVQFERPRMAGNAAQGSAQALKSDVRFLRNTVSAAWFANVLIVLLLLVIYPDVLVREGYERSLLIVAIGFESAVVLVRALREPVTTALQAGGAFKALAKVTIICAPITLALVIVGMLAFPHFAPFVLLGVLLGEMINFTLVSRRYSSFLTAMSKPELM